MGHDISAHKESIENDELAYLRRGAFNPLNRNIYVALDCMELNNGVSGCGDSREFSAAQIREALDSLGDGEDFDPERTFLRECIEAIDGDDDKLLIYFA
jgi:hypothetical protein